MKKVITYGTYDLLHYGHIKLLERAKKLGDYLIVGVTSDDYDRTRGKINVSQTLSERIEAVKSTGLADMIIVEEYEGQKIDDIIRYGVDIFTLGSDWIGKFDYLNDYCKVIYLDRTEGISSSKIRSEKRELSLGIVGNGENANFFDKLQKEDIYVNGVSIIGICTNDLDLMSNEIKNLEIVNSNYDEFLNKVDSIYLNTNVFENYEKIKKALLSGKSVLCESPIDISSHRTKELFDLAKKNNCVLMEGIRTAYSMAYSRLLLLLKAGKIGKILSVDATCTSMRKQNINEINSLYEWGPNALLPIFQILGVNYKSKRIISSFADSDNKNDIFTKVDFVYDHAVASIKVAEGAKSEGELIITGTKGYIVVPSPWWKMDYFEVKYEDTNNNKRYFYQLDGEGIRYELVAFTRSVQEEKQCNYIDEKVSLEISSVLEDFINKKDTIEI